MLQLDAACSPHLIKAVTASILTWLIQADADGLNLYFCPSCCDLRFLLAVSSCRSLPAFPGSRHLFCPCSTHTFKPLLVHQVPASIRCFYHSQCSVFAPNFGLSPRSNTHLRAMRVVTSAVTACPPAVTDGTAVQKKKELAIHTTPPLQAARKALSNASILSRWPVERSQLFLSSCLSMVLLAQISKMINKLEEFWAKVNKTI